MRLAWAPIVSILLFSFCFSGCGGGGAKIVDCTTGGVISSFAYTTTWVSGSSGQSQVLTLLDSSGNSVANQVLNRSTNQTLFSVGSLSSGQYRLVANLYSLADGQGTNIARIDARVTVCGTTSFVSQTGGTPQQVVINPQTATVNTSGSIQYSAYLALGTGTALFAPLNTITYSVLGGIGTISSDGLFLPTTSGTGTVRASYNPSLLVGSSSVTVTNFTPTRSKWTVLVYMNAANDLFSYSTLNMNQMERVAGNSDVRFVVQWKQAKDLFPGSTFTGTRRYLVQPDTSNSVVSTMVQDLGTGVDMGLASTLNEFITWGKVNYPSDRVALVIWNHGNGWQRSPYQLGRAVSYDDQTGNAIQTWELPAALGSNTFDIVAWDASLMQMLEVAYEIRNKAQFVVGSEESPPGEGYPYDLIFDDFRDNPNASTKDLTKAFIDGTLSFAPYASRKITQSSIETSKLPALAASVSTLADAMINNVTSMGTVAPSVRNAAQAYSPGTLRVYRDLSDVCRLLIANSSTPTAVKTAAANVQSQIGLAVVWEGHNANSPNSNGIAIDFSSNSSFGPLLTDYGRLSFSADTRWNEWLAIAP